MRTLDRLVGKIAFSEECWEWQGARDPKGYGRVSSVTYGQSLAHRVVYEAAVGTIPDGLVLDHLCRNPPCVNPDHLEVVTIGENTLRGDTLATRKKAQTHCIHGHLFDEANTYVGRKGTRSCRTCHRITERERQQRLKTQADDLYEQMLEQGT